MPERVIVRVGPSPHSHGPEMLLECGHTVHITTKEMSEKGINPVPTTRYPCPECAKLAGE